MADNRVAFITGANRGLGFETARELGEAGITVVLGSRDREKGEAAVAALHAKGIEAEAIPYDASDPSTVATVVEFFEKRYGRLDILVNNAGVMVERLAGANSTVNVSEEALRETFETNFFAVVSLTKALLPLIEKSPAGRIVNLSSILGSLTLHSKPGSPIYDSKAFAYNVSKTALNGFTVHLAALLKDTPIKVNAAHPGWVKTEMGGPDATLELSEGGKTSVQLATLDADGPTGGFFHLGNPLPW
ncbi:SDR family oxidoreductase [bacterium]|nr:MAG: SDR family oxidoreductase [bacterium]